MEKTVESLSACFRKPTSTNESHVSNENSENTEKSEISETTQTVSQPGFARRFGSGIYYMGAGATNIAVNSVKWAATTTYNIGSNVVSNGLTKVKNVRGNTKTKSE